jgi:glucokinase
LKGPLLPHPERSSESREAIGVDVGGTKITALRVSADGSVLADSRRGTPGGTQQDLVRVIVELIDRLRSERVCAVGIGLPGMVDTTSGALAFAPFLAFQRASLRAPLAAALGLPVLIENDANAAAWAEYLFGCGRGHDHMLLVTLGTGLGCGMVTDGRILRGAHGFAAEVSHLTVDPAGPLCRCGRHGCWGVMASGQAITRLARETVGDHPTSLLGRLGVVTGRLSGEIVTWAALEGDRLAIDLLSRVGTNLGKGLAALANMLDPSIIVVGGGPCNAGNLLTGPAHEAFLASFYAPSDRPDVPIVCATFGNDAGAIGAAALALDRFTPPKRSGHEGCGSLPGIVEADRVVGG